jgi:hypothetical protein
MSKVLRVALAQVTKLTTGAMLWGVLVVYVAILVLNVVCPYQFLLNDMPDIAMSTSRVLRMILTLTQF